MYVLRILLLLARAFARGAIWILILTQVLGPGWGLSWGRAFHWPAIAFAEEAPPASSNDIGEGRRLLSLFSEIQYTRPDPANVAEIKAHGESVHAFLASPAGQSLSHSPEGKALFQELTNRQIKLMNFLQVEKVMRNCEAAKEDDMAGRLLSIAAQAEVSNESLCDSSRHLEIMRLGGMTQDLSNVMDQLNGPDSFAAKQNRQMNLITLQDRLYRQSLKNATETYVTMKHRYRRGGADDTVNGKWIYPLLKGARSDVVKEMEEHANKVGSALKNIPNSSTDFQAAANVINKGVGKFNESLKKIPISTRGKVFKALNESKETTEGFERYGELYADAANTPDGHLMLTDTLMKKIGAAHTEKQVKERYFDYTLAPHQEVNSEDVAAAVQEAEGRIIDQSLSMTKTFGRAGKESTIMSNLEKLVTTNPAAVGQVLLSHPESAGYICEAIGQANTHRKEKAESDATWGKVFLWGGAIVGVALIATGVGAGLVAGAGWLFGAGAATATTMGVLGTTATVLGTTGTVVGLVGAGYETAQAYDAHQDFRATQASFLSGNGDRKQIAEAVEAHGDFKAKQFAAATQLAFSALDLGAMGATLKIADTTIDLAKRTAIMKTAAANLDTLVKDTTLLRGINANLKAASAATKNAFAKLLSYSLQVSEKLRVALLKRLQAKGTEGFQELVQKALVAAEKGCGGG